MPSVTVYVADHSVTWMNKLMYVESSVKINNFYLQFSYEKPVNLPSVINLRSIQSCCFPSSKSSNEYSFDIQLTHRSLSIVFQRSNQDTFDLIKHCLSLKKEEDTQQEKEDVVDFLVNYYMILSALRLEDLELDSGEFTLERKQKFIKKSNDVFIEGFHITQSMFSTLMNDPMDPKIADYPRLICDFPVASAIFVQCIHRLADRGESKQATDAILSYIALMREMVVYEEAKTTILDSASVTVALRTLLHLSTDVMWSATLLLSCYCEEVRGYADLIAQCFLDEKKDTSYPYLQTSLSLLMSLLVLNDVEVTLKMDVLKFLAVLEYSTESLSRRVALINEYTVFGFVDICNALENKYVKDPSDPVCTILSITREAMELTVTEDDLDTITSDDIPAIAQIVLNHCSDSTTQSLFMMLMRNIVELPSDGTYGHDLWTSLVEFSENLVNMLKKKKNEKALADKLEVLEQQFASLKKDHEDLEVSYNRARCREQELLDKAKMNQISSLELEKKLKLITRELEALKSQQTSLTRISMSSPPPPPPVLNRVTVKTATSAPGSPTMRSLPIPPPPPKMDKKKLHCDGCAVDVAYKKYFKLKKMHMPIEQLKIKMQSDGLDPSIIDGEEPQWPEEEDISAPSCAVDVAYKKYFKLKKMHMPIEQLKIKMQSDGLDPSIIDGEEPQWPEEEDISSAVTPVMRPALSVPPQPAPKPEPDAVTSPEPKMDSYVPPTRAKSTPSVSLRQVYWSPVSGSSLKDTLWEEIETRDDLDRREIEALFEVKKSTASPISTSLSSTTSTDEEVISFVDAKRETNIAIGLRKIRYSGDEIRQFLMSIDRFSLSVDALNVMKGILPKEDECSIIRSYQGSSDKLSFVNAFLYSVAEIPSCVDRVSALVVKATFNDDCEKVRQDLTDFESDCRLVQDNPHFHYLLEYLLELGNYLNGTSSRGGVCGFHLDILPLLERTKSSDNTLSIVDYIVKKLVIQRPDALKVISEFDVLARRTELSLDDINKSVQALSGSLNGVRLQISQEPMNDSDQFGAQMLPFYTNANEIMLTLQQYTMTVSGRYSALCKRFGEDPRQVKTTDFFGNIVTFVNCLKASQKHYLDVQAEEKLKKVACEWQSQTVSQIHRNNECKVNLPKGPPPMQHVDTAKSSSSGRVERRISPQVPDERPPNHGNNETGTKKQSLWAKLIGWGKAQ